MRRQRRGGAQIDFHHTFYSHVFPSWHRALLRGHGLLSGLTQRLYRVFDVNKSGACFAGVACAVLTTCSLAGAISFDEYLNGVFVFVKGSAVQRLRMCFQVGRNAGAPAALTRAPRSSAPSRRTAGLPCRSCCALWCAAFSLSLCALSA